MSHAPTPQTGGGGVFGVLAILCTIVFGICVVYGITSLLFPGIGEIGRFFAVGIPLEMGLLPSGLLACLFAGLWLAASGRQRQAGLAMAGTVLVSVVAYYLYSESSRRGMLERIEYVARLPSDLTELRKGEPLVDWRTRVGGSAQCADECQHLLYNGHLQAYVVPGIAADTGAPTFRVFRLSATSCPGPHADLRDRRFRVPAAILRVADHCIVAKDRTDPPDGIWVYGAGTSPEKPDYPFDGQLVTLTRQAAGKRWLIKHHEAGVGRYPKFPPMSCWVEKFKTVPLHFCRGRERYGRKRNALDLISETLKLESPRALFSKSAAEIARIGIGKFTQRYAEFSEAEKIRLFRSLALVLWEHPDLDRETPALVALGMNDSQAVVRTAEDVAVTAENRRMRDRKRLKRSWQKQPLPGRLEAQ